MTMSDYRLIVHRILAILTICLAVIFLIGSGVCTLLSKGKLRDCTAVTEGRVSGRFRPAVIDDIGGSAIYAVYTVDEVTYKARGAEHSLRDYYNAGDRISVNYDPSDPAKSYIGAPLSSDYAVLGRYLAGLSALTFVLSRLRFKFMNEYVR